MKNKEILQEEEYLIPYHHTVKEGEYAGISYFSVISIIKKIIKKISPKTILDFGCGDGKLIYELKNQDTELTGIDLSKKAISFAKIFSPKEKFIAEDINNYKPKEKFNMIISIETLEHIPPDQLKNIIKNLNRLVKENGYLIITVPSKNVRLFKKHYQHFDTKTMQNYLEGQFKIVKTLGHYKISKRYELLYALATNNYLSISSKKYQKFLNKYFKKNIERASTNNCRRLIFICKKLSNSF
jgi:2-polyprenyl-3-methyl-5-hydroxy-6-metoxy-1,4-benzoquinol methylase